MHTTLLQQEMPIRREREDLLPVFMLGCHRDIDLSVACLASIASRFKHGFCVTVLSDGSLTAEDSARLQASLPSLTILTKEDIGPHVIPEIGRAHV